MEMQHYHLWNAAKVILRWNFLAVQTFIKKQTKLSNKSNQPAKRIRRINKAQSQQSEENN